LKTDTRKVGRKLLQDYNTNPSACYDSPAKSQPASQNQRARQREKHYNMNILKKITVDDKDVMMSEIQRGRNKNGGAWGG